MPGCLLRKIALMKRHLFDRGVSYKRPFLQQVLQQFLGKESLKTTLSDFFLFPISDCFTDVVLILSKKELLSFLISNRREVCGGVKRGALLKGSS